MRLVDIENTETKRGMCFSEIIPSLTVGSHICILYTKEGLSVWLWQGMVLLAIELHATLVCDTTVATDGNTISTKCTSCTLRIATMHLHYTCSFCV